ASAETWQQVGGNLRALETLALRLPENSPTNRATLERIDSLVDSARHEIYGRADLDLAPLLASEAARLQSSGGTYLGYTPVLPALFARVPLASIPAIADDRRIARITEDHVVHALMDVIADALLEDTWRGKGCAGGTWELT